MKSPLSVIEYYDKNLILLDLKYSHYLCASNLEYMEEWWDLLKEISRQWDETGLSYEEYQRTFKSRLGEWV